MSKHDSNHDSAVADGVRKIGEGAKEGASAFGAFLKERAMDIVAGQQARVARSLDQLADVTAEAASALEADDDATPVPDAAQGASNAAHRLARYLQKNDVPDIWDDAKDFVKENPVPVITGAFLLGFMATTWFADHPPSESKAKRAGRRRRTTSGRARR
jgi:hypothetical protein